MAARDCDDALQLVGLFQGKTYLLVATSPGKGRAEWCSINDLYALCLQCNRLFRNMNGP